MSNHSVQSQPIQIILTGAIGVGKTTLANHLLALVPETVLGFRTLPLFENQTRVGFGFQPLGGEIKSFAQYNPLTKLYSVDLEVFETLGCAILQSALQTNTFLFIDEIGFFEKPAQYYCQLVKSVLGSQLDYLVVIQQRELDCWLEDLPRAELGLYEVNTENRNRLQTELASRIKNRQPS